VVGERYHAFLPQTTQFPLAQLCAVILAILQFHLTILKPLRDILSPHLSQRIANLAEGDVVFDTSNEEGLEILLLQDSRATLSINDRPLVAPIVLSLV
jgi:hypothetical protein